mgnify:CR=1 FL=1
MATTRRTVDVALATTGLDERGRPVRTPLVTDASGSAIALEEPRASEQRRVWECLQVLSGADLIVAEMERGGGMITEEDLARYEAVEREPIVGTYRGHDVISMPPPSSGGIALVEMLNILEGYDLAAMGHNSAPYLHHLAESMRRALAAAGHSQPLFVGVTLRAPGRRAPPGGSRGPRWGGRGWRTSCGIWAGFESRRGTRNAASY